ncbi:MAG: site-specific integrase [Firmicutes bacterium]|nr:site-specific integrase [Bacillota bacterium]
MISCRSRLIRYSSASPSKHHPPTWESRSNASSFSSMSRPVIKRIPSTRARSRFSIQIPSAAPANPVVPLNRSRGSSSGAFLIGEIWEDNNLVFCTEIGTPINPPNLHRRSFRPILQRAGVREIRIHDLRHTCATLLLLEGTNPRVVQEQLGHSNIATTLGLYSHVLPSMKKQVASTMDALFGSGKGEKKTWESPSAKV